MFRNYDAIYSYNAAESYALAIATLADQLRGGTGLATWPTDDPGIGRDERRQLQTLLLAPRHDIGSADGMIGTATRRAIQVEQQRLGWAADGRAGQRILRTLQNAPRTAPVPRVHASQQLQCRAIAGHTRSIPRAADPGCTQRAVPGLDAWLVETGDASAAISVFGGQLLSFVPGAAGSDVAVPRRAELPTPTEAALCWPYFGRQSQQRRARPRFRPYRAVGTATGPSPGRRQHRAHAGTPVLQSLDLRLRMTVRVGAS